MDSVARYTSWFRAQRLYQRPPQTSGFLGGEALAHANLVNTVHDLALLNVLGVRVVLVHGGRPQLNEALTTSEFHDGRRDLARKSDHKSLRRLRADLEALFSTGLPNTPLHNVEINLVSGNFIAAQPIGIVDGIDHQCWSLAQCEYSGDSKFIGYPGNRVAVAHRIFHLWPDV